MAAISKARRSVSQRLRLLRIESGTVSIADAVHLCMAIGCAAYTGYPGALSSGPERTAEFSTDLHEKM